MNVGHQMPHTRTATNATKAPHATRAPHANGAATANGAANGGATARAVRRAVTAALAGALVAGTASTATARPQGDDGSWHGEGLSLTAPDNRVADDFIDRARRAERDISPQVRAAAQLSGAELVGFDARLKSPDSLKRKVATSMKETPGQTVDEALARINDSVRYTLQWPDARYTRGVEVASTTLSHWGNKPVKWSNTWSRANGYKAVNSSWSAPRGGHRYEVQFHTPASKEAQLKTHKLYEEQRLPSTSPERAKALQREQDRIFAAVPVPAGAPDLRSPAPYAGAGERTRIG